MSTAATSANTLPNVFGAAPGALEGLRAISAAIEASGADLALLELAYVRASQLNGCAFCVGHHVVAALKLGVSQRKLHLVATWRDADDFTATEKAVLAYAEAVTLSPGRDGVAHGPLARAVAEAIGENGLRQLALALAYINAWNRIGAVFGFQPPAGF